MALTQINSPTPLDLENIQTTSDTQRRAKADNIDFTFSGSEPTEVLAGSVFDVNGALFEVQTSNLAISGSVTASVDNYLLVDTVAGTVTWSTTVPSYEVAKGGWYSGADYFLPYAYLNALSLNKLIVNSINVESEISIGGVRGWNVSGGARLVNSSSLSENDLFNSVYNYIPNTGDKVMASGGFSTGPASISSGNNDVGFWILSYIERRDSSTIWFHCASIIGVGSTNQAVSGNTVISASQGVGTVPTVTAKGNTYNAVNPIFSW